MIIRCPACGAEMSLDTVIEHTAAAQALAIALNAAPLGAQIVRYLALFRPQKRLLTWPRVAALLGELLPAIKAGRLERDGRVHEAPLAAWSAALEKTLQARDAGTLRTPLKSHGYLFEIVITEARLVQAMVVRDTDPDTPARPTSAVAKAVGTLEQRKRRNDAG